MKEIVAISCSPRFSWHSATLAREAAKGAESESAELVNNPWEEST